MTNTIKSTIIFFLLFCFAHLYGQKKAEKTFALPKIKALKYLPVSTALENIFLNKSCQDSTFKFFNSYNKRLTNVREYEVYLIKKNCSDISKLSCICDGTNQLMIELLVLYNKEYQQAYLIVGSYSFLSDSEVYDMSFKIKDNQITLIESGVTEGERGNAEQFSKAIHKIKVLKTDKFRISNGK